MLNSHYSAAQNLWRSINMSGPQSWLEITTAGKCTINCSFCPQEVLQENYQGCMSLSLKDFKEVLSKVPKTTAIHFSGFAEPFLNPQCIDMIEHAHSQGFKICIYSTLIGLRTEDVPRLQHCNPQLFLHLPDNLGNAKIPITEVYKDTLISVLKLLRIDGFFVMNENFKSNERAGFCKNVPKRHLYGWFYCQKLHLPQFVMLPNCDVVLCCMDYGLTHRIGNLLQQSYIDILNSVEYQKVRSSRYKIDSNGICRKCAWAMPFNKAIFASLSYRISRAKKSTHT
jgi:sulfatase maturation enzyme AslB (radical SAM superfamily)